MNSNLLNRATAAVLLFLCFAVTPSFAQYQYYRNQTNALVWFLNGVNYGNKGDFNNAIYAFDQAIRLKPDYGQAWFYKGVALARSGRHNEAMPCIQRAMQLNPGYADNPGTFELLRSLGLPIGPVPQAKPNLNPYSNFTPPDAKQDCAEARQEYQECMANAREITGLGLKASVTAGCRDILKRCP